MECFANIWWRCRDVRVGNGLHGVFGASEIVSFWCCPIVFSILPLVLFMGMCPGGPVIRLSIMFNP